MMSRTSNGCGRVLMPEETATRPRLQPKCRRWLLQKLRPLLLLSPLMCYPLPFPAKSAGTAPWMQVHLATPAVPPPVPRALSKPCFGFRFPGHLAPHVACRILGI